LYVKTTTGVQSREGLGRLEAVPIDDLDIRDAFGLFYKGGLEGEGSGG